MIMYPIYAFHPPNVDQDDDTKDEVWTTARSLLKWAQNKIFALGEAVPKWVLWLNPPNEFWVPFEHLYKVSGGLQTKLHSPSQKSNIFLY